MTSGGSGVSCRPGGGYAMVSLLERDLTAAGWLTSAEFADIVAVSQATPGPLALNVATYAGLQPKGDGRVPVRRLHYEGSAVRRWAWWPEPFCFSLRPLF